MDEKMIQEELLKVGIPPHVLGFKYLVKALKLIRTDESYLNSMTRGLYPEVAKKCETTPSRAERAMRHAVEIASSRCNDRYREMFECLGAGRPSNSEFLAMMNLKMG